MNVGASNELSHLLAKADQICPHGRAQPDQVRDGPNPDQVRDGHNPDQVRDGHNPDQVRDGHDPGIKPTPPVAPALQADSLLLSHQGSPPFCIERK